VRIDVVSLFPDLFQPFLRTSLVGRAAEAGVIGVTVHDLRPHGLGKHHSVDDEPYGGGAGMVMRPEPIFDAVEPLLTTTSHVVLLSPKGRLLNHDVARELATHEHLVLICGRYEGVDERVAEHLCDDEISIGDYVVSGGEVAALVVVEAVSRFVPGVLGNPESLEHESHAGGTLEYPQYTRPAVYRGLRVPDVLLSGDHGAVERWRRDEATKTTRARRPDLSER
jgi:tRNA (guanine37-N1)-methyltransferase